MSRATEEASSRLDDAARAGWLYYIAGNTQEEIAAKLGISRQGAQRLVSLSVSAGLVKVRIDHPIAACLEIGRRLSERFGLRSAEVVPSDPESPSTTLGIAEACAARIERTLLRPEPLVVGVGTGRTCGRRSRTCRACAAPSTGSSRSPATSLPMGPPRSTTSSSRWPTRSRRRTIRCPSRWSLPPEERALLQQQKVVRASLELAREADIAFVGIGEVGPQAQLLMDRFISEAERDELVATGGIGEVVGWVYDSDGRILDCAFNKRVVSPPFPLGERTEVVGVAMGASKRDSILAALRGRLVGGLITDEATAQALLS